MTSAGLRTAKQGAVATGGITPSKRSPVSGSSAETMGVWSLTSRRTWAATMRTMRSASAAPMRSPLSSRPTTARSIHRRPSGLTITSMTVGSASAAAMLGPKAVRSICRRRPCASSVAKTVTSLIVVSFEFDKRAVAFLRGSIGLGVRRRTRRRKRSEQVRVGVGDGFQHLDHEAAIALHAAANLADEHLEAFAPHRSRPLLFALRPRWRGGEVVADERPERFADHSHVPFKTGVRAAEVLEAAAPARLDTGQRLRFERGFERVFDHARFAAVGACGHLLELQCQWRRQPDGEALLAHLQQHPL